MHWVFLMVAILLEVCGTVSMKLSHGLERLTPTVFVYVFYFASFYFLAAAIKQIDVGVAYAIWAGTGTALIGIVGIAYFKEPFTLIKVACTLLIIVGVVGLKLSADNEPKEKLPAAANTNPIDQDAT